MVKILSILIILGGVVLMLASPVLGLVFIAIGAGLLIVTKKSKQAAKPAARERRTYDIAGVNYCEDALEEIAEESEEYGYSKKKIIDNDLEDEEIFKYSYPTFGKLQKDPENEHDKNAIKVLCGGVHVGFIPAKKAVEVGEIMDTKKIVNVSVFIEGGEYKRYGSDAEEMEKGEKPFSGSVTVEYEV